MFLIASILYDLYFAADLSQMHSGDPEVLEGTIDSVNFCLRQFEETFLIFLERFFNDGHVGGSPPIAIHRHSDPTALQIGHTFEESFDG